MEKYKTANHADGKSHKIAVVSKVNKDGTVETEESTYRPKFYPKQRGKTGNKYKPKGDIKTYKSNKPYEKKDEKFDIDKWFKNNPTPTESPRGKKNTRKK